MSQISRTRRPRVAVAGATGRVGSTLIASLVGDPLDVVALTRTPDSARLPSGVRASAVDFDAPATLALALRGVDRLFLSHGTSLRQVANEIALIDAAVAAGVGHIVKLSVLGPPSRLHPFDWHMQIESHLATCDVGYTILRPSSFFEVLARSGSAVAADAWGGAAGDGLANFIDTRDVAECARVALLDHASTDSQRAYHLTGPRSWSMTNIAGELSRLIGRTVTYHRRTPAEQRVTLLAAGLSEFVADLLIGLDKAFHDSAVAETTSTVDDLTGHAPRTLTAWLTENISLFRG